MYTTQVSTQVLTKKPRYIDCRRRLSAVTIYDVNGDVLRNKIIVDAKQRERTISSTNGVKQQRPHSANNVNVDIFTCLGRRELEER